MPQPSTHRPIPPSSTRLGAALVVPLLSVVCLGACQLERLFPKDVANGAARLTVLNAGVLAKLIQDDTGCGFSSEAGINTYTVEGETGGIGARPGPSSRSKRNTAHFGQGSGTTLMLPQGRKAVAPTTIRPMMTSPNSISLRMAQAFPADGALRGAS